MIVKTAALHRAQWSSSCIDDDDRMH